MPWDPERGHRGAGEGRLLLLARADRG
jgi:hypothetical protein